MKVWLAKSKWIFWVILAVAVGFIAVLLGGILIGGNGKKKVVLPDVAEKLKEKVRKVEEEALIEKVKAKCTADADKKELEEIAKEPDGKKRRSRLAEKLGRA